MTSWWGVRVLVVLGVVLAAAFANAQTPEEAAKGLIQDFQQLIVAPAHERAQRVSKLLDDRFATEEFLKSALWRYWSGYSAADQRKLVESFSRVLARNILEQLPKLRQRHFASFQIIPEPASGPVSPVRIVARNKEGQKVSIDAAFLLSGKQWRLSNVQVEGADLRVNYEGQFNYIIHQYGTAELLRRIEAKAKTGS